MFSEPRINGMADRMNILPGVSLDLTSVDPDGGKPWDFNDDHKRKKAMDMVISKKALLLIGSPPCKTFSRLMNWNWKEWTPEGAGKCKMKAEFTLTSAWKFTTSRQNMCCTSYMSIHGAQAGGSKNQSRR